MLRRDPLRNPERLIRRVYAFAAYRLGDGPDAEDVTSEVFEHALRYRDSYDPAKGEPIAWLLGIARRCIASTLASAQPVVEGPPEVADRTDVEAETVRRLSLGRALGRLSEHDRELIALRYGADLRAREIAALLDSTTNAVEVALHRALKRLRAELAPAERASRAGLEPERLRKPVEEL
jgi:RNA polymerase sigma-70 factor (ECF subfamily)